MQTWEVATTREMAIMAPYCFHIGIAIGFTICELALRTDRRDQLKTCIAYVVS